MDASPSRPVQPMGAVDEGIVHLDSAFEPWSVHVELHFGTALEEARLRQAVHVALQRHPRARARMVTLPGWRRPYGWEFRSGPDVDPFDLVECSGDEALALARDEFESCPVSLRAAPPLRVRLLRHPAGAVLMLNVHHAAGDGMAALVFLQSVARAYASKPEAVNDVAWPVGVATSWRQAARPVRTVLTELGEAGRPSAKVAADGGQQGPGYRLQLVSLDAARTAAIVERAGDGTTVNDLLLSALHRAVDTWNREHGTPTGRISVLMPVNLRPRSRWREGFGNFTFMVPVTTQPCDRRRLDALVESVRCRTAWVKAHGSPAAVVELLQRLQALPLPARSAIARYAAHERLTPTTLLSNLGRLECDLDFGLDAGRPTGVWFSPPARMPLGLAVGALTSGDELRLAFRIRRPLLGRDAAARFAARYVSALDDLTIAARLAPGATGTAVRAA